MREYELVYIGHPMLTEAQMEQMNERLKGVIERHDGRLFYAKSLGKRTLAYRIKKQIKGTYYSLCYAADGSCNSELERQLMMDENVLRFLTVLKAKDIDVEVRAAEIEAQGESLAQPEEGDPVVAMIEKEKNFEETVPGKGPAEDFEDIKEE